MDSISKCRKLTFESHRHTLHRVQALPLGQSLIPVAEPGQATFEACVLENLRDVRCGRESPHDVPFGLTWVSPRVDSLGMGGPLRLLPCLLRELLPTSYLEDKEPAGSDEVPEVSGVLGLRAVHRKGKLLLYRIDLPGKIIIPVSAQDWHKARFIALDPDDDNLVDISAESPNELHPWEEKFFRKYPELSGEQARPYDRLASDVLRRLPGLCQPASSHDLWTNDGTIDYQINLEWALAHSFSSILDLLLDEEVGLDVDLELFPDQSLADCYADYCPRVRLVSRDASRAQLHLRRLVYPGADEHAADFLTAWRQKRQVAYWIAEQRYMQRSSAVQ